MPVHNGEKYIREAIESILAQTFTDFELLVIDDSSTDKSVEIAKTYGDPRIRLLKNEAGRGVVGARNTGLIHARGEYIAPMDCDDIAHPEKLAIQVAFLDGHPDVGMVGSGIELIDEEGRSLKGAARYTSPPEMIRPILLFHNYFCQSSVLVRARILPEEPYRNYPGTEDYDMWVRIAGKSKVVNLSRVLVKYRVHQNSLSFSKARAIDGYVTEIVRNQLEVLGLCPTEQELALHRTIGGMDIVPSPDLLRNAERWLLNLEIANSKTNIYDKSSFAAVLGDRWYDVCIRCSEMGLSAWKAYWRSPLSRRTPLRMGQRTFLLASTVFRLKQTSRERIKRWALAGAGMTRGGRSECR